MFIAIENNAAEWGHQMSQWPSKRKGQQRLYFSETKKSIVHKEEVDGNNSIRSLGKSSYCKLADVSVISIYSQNHTVYACWIVFMSRFFNFTTDSTWPFSVCSSLSLQQTRKIHIRNCSHKYFFFFCRKIFYHLLPGKEKETYQVHSCHLPESRGIQKLKHQSC